MDIHGFRGRSSSLMRSTHHDPMRKRRDRHSVSLATCATLLLLFVLAAWTGFHRFRKRGDTPASGGRGSTNGSAASLPPVLAQSSKVAATRQARSDVLMADRVERSMRLTPVYRGPGKVETYPQFGSANRVLLASHGRLMWYRYDTDELHVLHEGEGAYHGAFPGIERGLLGEPTTLWVLSRPHNWRSETTHEWLIQLDLESGREVQRVQVGSRWGHDAVRRRDRVYVASTGDGRVLELAVPNMTQIRELPLFTVKEHLNHVAPTPDGKLWALLHSLGPSSLVQVDLASGRELRRIHNVGDSAHGLVFWSTYILTLDSAGGGLMRTDPATGEVHLLWQNAGVGRYLKGLCVVDDVAFFGISPHSERRFRDSPTLNCELAAFDLRSNLLLWRRQMPTRGLLNIVAAPHLVVESTSYSVNTADQISYRGKKAFADAVQAVQQWQLQQEREAQGMQGAAHTVGTRSRGSHAVHGRDAGSVSGRTQDGVLGQGQDGGGVGGAAERMQEMQQGGGTEDAVHDQAQQAPGARVVEPRLQQGAAARIRAPAGGQQHQQQQEQQQQGMAADGQRQRQHQQRAASQAGLQQDMQQGIDAQQHQQEEHHQQQQQQQQQGSEVASQAGVVRRSLTETEPEVADNPLAQFPPLLDPVRWSSGLPRLLLGAKHRGLVAGAQLRLMRVDTAGLKAALQEMPESDWEEAVQRESNAWVEGRGQVLHRFKPGTQSILLLFSDQDGRSVYRFPWYHRYQQWVEPWLQQVLGPGDMDKLMRVQLALMQPQTDIKRHLDSGGYSRNGHRIHVVVQSNPDVRFRVCDSGKGVHAAEANAAEALNCVPIHVEEGLVFELNNRLLHDVTNNGHEPRIHLVVDVAETPRQQQLLRVGQVCHYVHGGMDCPEESEEVGADEHDSALRR